MHPVSVHPHRDPGAVSGDREKSITGEKNSGEDNFFSPVLDFSPSPLTDPGSPRMVSVVIVSKQVTSSGSCFLGTHSFSLVVPLFKLQKDGLITFKEQL